MMMNTQQALLDLVKELAPVWFSQYSDLFPIKIIELKLDGDGQLSKGMYQFNQVFSHMIKEAIKNR